MSDTIITALAALSGTLVGGLTNVLATHLQGKSAAQRERERRSREAAYAEYDAMKTLLSEFLGGFTELYAHIHITKDATNSDMMKWHVKAAETRILAPDMVEDARALQKTLREDSKDDYKAAVRNFEKSANRLLARMNPDTPE